MANSSPVTLYSGVNQPMPVQSGDGLIDKDRELSEACKRRAHLDGEFFEVDLPNSVKDGRIIAECKLCTPVVSIKRTLQSSTNFIQHLKVCLKFIQFKRYVIEFCT